MASRSPMIHAAVDSFDLHADRWRQIAESDSPLRQVFPTVLVEDEERILSNFQRLCLVKALAPGKFVPAVRELVVQEQGERYLNPPLFDIERSY